MKYIGLDVGNIMSSFVIYSEETKTICEKYIMPNYMFLKHMPLIPRHNHIIGIEWITSYGMAVGKSVFETAIWIGRFVQMWKILGGRYIPVYRHQVKMHFCNSTRAKDSNIRQALIDRFETGLQGKERPKGVCKGLKKDEWSAFAVAIYTMDNIDVLKEGD